MDIAEFEDLLDRLGDDVSRWPESQRRAAEALVAESAEARALLAEAAMLRGALSSRPVRAPAGLADRIVARAVQPVPAPKVVDNVSAVARLSRVLSIGWKPLAAICLPLCFLFGILVGIVLEWEQVEANHVDLPAYMARVIDKAPSAFD
jgi:hypothetical protein